MCRKTVGWAFLNLFWVRYARDITRTTVRASNQRAGELELGSIFLASTKIDSFTTWTIMWTLRAHSFSRQQHIQRLSSLFNLSLPSTHPIPFRLPQYTARQVSTKPSHPSPHSQQRSLRSETLLYENTDQSFYRVAYFAAGGQLLLWLTFGDWCYRDLRVSKEMPDGTKEYVLAPTVERTTAAAFCLGVGGLFASAVHLWSSR